MSQENVEAVRAVYDEWGKGNFRASEDLLDPHVLFILSPGFPEAGTYLGTERMAEYTRNFLAAWENITITADEFIEAGDSVVVAVHQRGEGRESGTLTELRYFQVWTFRGREVTRIENVRSRTEALEAVGLSE
jgi:ketosteroid isomerase-like protein